MTIDPAQTVRVASSADLAALRSFHVGDDSLRLPLSVEGVRYWLVLDAPDGGLAAAAHVLLNAPNAMLELVVVRKAFANHGVGEQLLSVVVAMCEMFGCRSLEMPGMTMAAAA